MARINELLKEQIIPPTEELQALTSSNIEQEVKVTLPLRSLQPFRFDDKKLKQTLGCDTEDE
jgi:hypothetical protein